MANPQVFTLEAVNALIPELTAIVEKQLERRNQIDRALHVLGEMLGEVPEEIVLASADSIAVRSAKGRLLRRIEEYQRGWYEVEKMGVVLKDPQIGLFDFYGRVDGELVWLCWKYGETEVTHYHALYEGFSARKQLKTSMRVRLLN